MGLIGAQETTPARAVLSGTAYRLVDQTIVDGYVVDETQVPVTNGRIAIPELGIDEPLADDGTFSLSNLPVSADLESPTEVTVIFTALGVGSFTYEHLRLYPGTLGWILRPQMIDAPRVNDRRDAHVDRPRSDVPVAETTPQPGPSIASSPVCPPVWEPGVFPETIRVWHDRAGQDQQVHVENFEYYLRAVLPNEWIPSWDDNSVWAGAMAVKSYAWWHATHGFMHSHKANPGPECYDVDASDSHQIFDPSTIHDITDDYVDLTWDSYYMFKDDGSDVIEALYIDGFGDACGWYDGSPTAPGDKMSAWGSHACANLGMNALVILNTYYFSASWTLLYKLNDTDGDGCKNGQEVRFHLRRNPLDPWDYYDVSVPKDGVIDLPNDILGVILHFAPGGYPPGDENFDRGPSTGPNTWNMTAPDGVIDLPNDILGVIFQFNHNCA